jgi:hypothetical protein
MMKSRNVALSLGLALAGFANVNASELILNGGFEAGFAAWGVVDQAGGSGSWFIDNDGLSPLNSSPQSGPASGLFFAVTDQTGPGAHVLFQSFTVPLSVTASTPVILSLQYFINNDNGAQVGPGGGPIDYTGGPAEFGSIDILNSGNPFEAPGTAYLHVLDGDVTSRVDPWHAASWDLTGLLTAGDTYMLRIAEVDNQFFFGMGIDDVSLFVEDGGHPVPEVQTYASLFGAGLVALEALRRRKAARA